MTREEIVSALAERLARRQYYPLEGSVLENRQLLKQGGASFLSSDVNVDALVSAWQANDNCKFGSLIIEGIKQWMLTDRAIPDVEADLSPDDTLDLTEIEKLL